MSDIVNVNQDYVEEYSTNVSGAASYFRVNVLVPCDGKSTISANGKGKGAYAASQSAIELFGQCLEQEATNIRSLGAKFAEYDEMLTDLWNSGTRYPVIKAVD